MSMVPAQRRVLSDVNIKNQCENHDASSVSPNANLKLLTKVASSCKRVPAELPQSCAATSAVKKEFLLPVNSAVSTHSSNPKARKEKSLGLLCFKFLQLFPLDVACGQHFSLSLDGVATQLQTERRRVYDIVNILESLHMAYKVGKNRYLWYGNQNLRETLAQLKALAIKLKLQQQGVFKPTKLRTVEVIKVLSEPTPCSVVQVKIVGRNNMRTVVCSYENTSHFTNLKQNAPVVPAQTMLLLQQPGVMNTAQPQRDIGKVHSLGILCQKFIMLILTSDKNQVINLEKAATVLIEDLLQKSGPAGSSPTSQPTCHQNSSTERWTLGTYKTKVRRLYDIANVLTALGLIIKVKNVEKNVVKSGYRYTGPDVGTVQITEEGVNLARASRHSLLGDSWTNPGRSVQAWKDLERTPMCSRKRQGAESMSSPKRANTSTGTGAKHSRGKMLEIAQVAEMELRRLHDVQDRCSGRTCGARKSLFPSAAPSPEPCSDPAC